METSSEVVVETKTLGAFRSSRPSLISGHQTPAPTAHTTDTRTHRPQCSLTYPPLLGASLLFAYIPLHHQVSEVQHEHIHMRWASM